MRILQLTLRIPYPLRDGGAIAIYNNTKSLAKAGHSMTLVALNTRKHRQDPAVMQAFAKVHTTDVDTTPKPLPALKNLCFGQLPYNIERFDVPAHHDLIAKVLEADDYDVILLERAYLGVYLPTIRRHTQAPVVLRAHNVEYEIWQRMAQNETNPLKKWFYGNLAQRGRRFERQLLPQLDGIVAITERDAAHLKQLGYSGQLAAIPAGFDIPEVLPTVAQTGDVAFLGSLDWLPNQQGLFWLIDKVWPLVRRQLPHAKLHVAGRNPTERVLNIDSPGVHIIGEVDDAQQFLLAHPVCVVPLLAGSGMRIKILEAMGLGRAIVTTPIGVEGILAQHDTHLMIADQPVAFASAIIRLLQSRATCWQLGTAAREQIHTQYAWPAIAQRFTDFFERLIANVASE